MRDEHVDPELARRITAALVHASAELQRELDLPTCATAIVGAALHITSARVAVLHDVDDDARELAPVELGARDVPGPDMGAPLPLDGESLPAYAAHTARVEPSGDLHRRMPGWFGPRGYASAVSVPLAFDGRVRSVLSLGFGARHDAPEVVEDVAVVDALRSLFAMARARSLDCERERRARAELDAARAAMITLAESRDLEAAMRVLVRQAREVLGTEYAAIGILGPDPKAPFDPWIYDGMSAETAAAIGRTPRPVGLLGEVPATSVAVRVERLEDDPRHRGLPPNHPPIGPFLGVPVRHERAAVGHLYVGRRPGRAPFTAEDQRTLELLARHAAIQLDRIELSDRLRAQVEALEGTKAELEISEERLARTLDDAPIGMALVGLDGRFLRVNRALCRIVGYGAEELEHLRFQDITHPDDLESDLALVSRLLRGEIERYQLGKRYLRKDGSVVRVQLSASIVRDRSGAPLHYIAQVEDVTERRRIEDALRASERQMRGLFENALDAILVADATGVVLDANPAACALTGLEREALLGRGLSELVAGEAGASFDERWSKLLDRGEQKGDAVLVSAAGTAVDVEYSARAHFVPGRHLVVLRDVTEQRRAEAALRRSEESLARAQRIAHIGNWDWDRTAGTLEWSEELYRLFGVTRGEFPGTYEAFLELVHPADRDVLRDAVGTALAGGRPFNIDHRILRPDGQERVLHAQADVIRDRSGAPIRMVGTAQDVTDQRRAEQAVRRSEERFRMVVEHAMDAVLLADLEGRFIDMNDAATRMFGYAREELLGRAIVELVRARDVPRLSDLRDLILRGGSQIAEWEVLCKDGTWLPIEASTTLLPDRRWLAFARDIRERKRVEEQVRTERTWLSQVIDRSPVGIVLCEDPEGRTVRANRRAEDLLGALVREKGIAQYAGRVTAPDGTPLGDDELPVRRALHGETAMREALACRPDGRKTPVLASAGPIRDDRERLLGAVVVYEDLGPLKQLDRLREEWTSMVAHELRQPVTVIAANAMILSRRGDEPERARADHILASAKRLDRMIGDLLDVSRLESHRLQITRAPVDVPALARALAAQNAAEARGRAIHVHERGEIPKASADAARVEQVLGNLISNALKYGDPGTDVTIAIEPRGDDVAVTVSNRGPGIAPEVQSKLFQRFERGSAAGTRVVGVGLGLYISKGIVEAHGGRMWIESTPGDTTTFGFTLPAARGAGTRAA